MHDAANGRYQVEVEACLHFHLWEYIQDSPPVLRKQTIAMSKATAYRRLKRESRIVLPCDGSLVVLATRAPRSENIPYLDRKWEDTDGGHHIGFLACRDSQFRP